MKVSFTLDTTGTSYEIEDESDIPAVLMNIGQLFQKLQNTLCLEKMRIMTHSKLDKATKDAICAVLEEQDTLMAQLFHEYRIEGEVKDGRKFVFTHKEPGYREELTWID